MCVLSFFFFFKQKTAYEMRISDWSSDVCSSDLPVPRHHHPFHHCPSFLWRPDYAFRSVNCCFCATNGRKSRMSTRPRVDAAGRCVRPINHCRASPEIGRASCRERVCQYVKISVVAGTLKKKQT